MQLRPMTFVPRSPLRAVLSALALLAATPAAGVPGSVNFQGLLLDAQGDPVTGNVALVLRLHDAESDGTLLWTESHASVEVLDGVYSVALGSITPLTQTILATPMLYLETEVDGDTLAPRQRLLAVPYALRAGTTESVDTLPSGFVTELIEHVNLDGGGPPNLDPSEGLGDTDGDGIANFVDPDNDGDGLSDGVEVAQGSDINVVTPSISGFDPATADGFTTTTVEVQGMSFVGPLSVVFGTETPTPMNVTSSSFDVDVGPQPEGTAAVEVTNANGESATSSFSFFLVSPMITVFDPVTADGFKITTVEVQGSGFVAPLSVVFGSETPTAVNVTPTSFEVDVGPTQPDGDAMVQVTNANGKVATSSFPFFLIEPVVTGFDPELGLSGQTNLVTVQGTGFIPGVTVSFGTLTPTPFNVTPTSFQVNLGPNPGGAETVDVTVTNPNGKSTMSSYRFITGLERVVFVTTPFYTGDLVGVAGADAACAAQAAAAGLSGSFLAWIGDGTTDPAARFTQDGGPYERVDGTIVASDFEDLTDGALAAPIDVTEAGASVSPFTQTWTAVQADGTSTGGDDCSGWTSALSGTQGGKGLAAATDGSWTVDGTASCAVGRRLYCFQQ